MRAVRGSWIALHESRLRLGYPSVPDAAQTTPRQHRQRKKLQEFYADTPSAVSQLIVPRGEYRLTLAAGAVSVDAEEEPLSLPEPPRRARPSRRFCSAVVLFAICNALIWAIIAKIQSPESEAAKVAATSYSKPLAAPGRPTLVVMGDYFIFGESPDQLQVTRLVREFEINSRDDLATYLMGHPDDYGRYVDVDLHYLPVSVGHAMRDLPPVINVAVPDVRAEVIPVSQMTPPVLRTANVVYVGFLSGLGPDASSCEPARNSSLGSRTGHWLA